MSEKIAVSDNATVEEASMQNEEIAVASVTQAAEELSEQPTATPAGPSEVPLVQAKDTPPEVKKEPPQNLTEETEDLYTDIKEETNDLDFETTAVKDEFRDNELDAVIKELQDIEDVKQGIKRRASDAFSDDGDIEFQGFVGIKQDNVIVEYNQVLERLEAEVSAASKTFTSVRYVMATPPTSIRALKRSRKDTGTDGSRPSSAQSSRSEDDPSASPAQRGRRTATEISSPLLRVPLERGWKRELVYRAALDLHSRRNADIYYYTPQGKKLRSTREIADNLSGTGLTLDNFSFFKEPLGVDDPDKEIIRDAKQIRRESPVASPAPASESKRAHKPKAPKGASPEPVAVKTTPLKIKVKSVGSRVSGATVPTKQEKPEKQKQKKPSPAPAPAATPASVTPTQPDNNNTAAWKKPRAPPAAPDQEPTGAPTGPTPAPVAEPSAALVRTRSRSLHVSRDAATSRESTPMTSSSRDVPPPQPAVPRLTTPPPQAQPPPRTPADLSSPDIQSPRRVLQPCSLLCGAGVPSLSCAACLCMYHPRCAGLLHGIPQNTFLCKNCRKSDSPPPGPVPVPVPVPVKLAPAAAPPATLPTPRRVPAPPKPNEKRVTLRMKVSGGADGNKVWAVAAPRAVTPRCAALPQSLALINGKRFIVVPRPAPLPLPATPAPSAHESKLRGRLANGTVSPAPAAVQSPRRRGRPRNDEVDHFTAFCNRAQQGIVIQIFQYLGMRDLAHCARVSKLWKQLAATPSLWRHVRMKNSQVSDWGGLCAALKRHGTKWLDLRKMLLPQNDVVFWEQFANHIGSVDTLDRLEMCRCPARAVEAAAGALPGLRALTALAIRDAALDPAPLACANQLRELRLKSMAGLALTADLTHLSRLTHLHHLSLTSIKELGWRACDVIGSLPNLESLELGECTFRAEFAGVLARLTKLTRLRLERGTAACAAPAILRALAKLPRLQRLELVNVDVKIGFDDALAECTNIQRLLIIPTYVSQSATTNKQVLSGVLRLKETLTHLMWGVTIELLRVTELFIDQCSAGGGARKDLGECIPVLKPVPGCRLPMDHQLVAGPPQVEILPLPTLQRLLSAQLPNTKLKLLRIPFHATWRQSLADFQ